LRFEKSKETKKMKVINNETKEPEFREEIESEETAASSRAARKKPMVIAASILAVVLLGVAALFWYRSGGEAGKPVPAPRTVSFDQENAEGGATIPAGQTITIQPDQLQNADIKIETVGEQINAEQVGVLATGTVQANAYRDTPVISLVGGVVRQISIEAGEFVRAGQTVAVVFSNEFAEAQSRYLTLLTERENARRNFERTQKLVQINQTGRAEFEQAERQLKAAEAALSEARLRYERTQKLIKIGAASREELEQDTTKLRTAEAETAEARLRLERARQLLVINPQSRAENEEAQNKLRAAESETATARQRLLLYGMSPSRIDALRSVAQISSEIAVPAPVSGTVTSRAANVGETIEANKELGRITNLSSVWVVAQVFEKDLGRLRAGSGASVTTDAFPDRVFRGTVTYIDPRLDETTRTAQARVELENPDNLLKIGMYVRVAFGALGDAERTAPVVVAAAVQNIGSRQIVFVATAQPNIFELRPVRLGAESNGQFPVLEGLSVGDRVVTTGSFLLRAEWLKQNPGG
jgi:RND family efflux transporter MFP subunit